MSDAAEIEARLTFTLDVFRQRARLDDWLAAPSESTLDDFEQEIDARVAGLTEYLVEATGFRVVRKAVSS